MSLLPYFNDELEACCDEAGLGCLAGPVYAAAVIWPHPDQFEEEHQGELRILNDSKKLTEKKRLRLKKFIEHYAISYSVASIDEEEIDKINIYNARMKAMHNAVKNLSVTPESLVIDGDKFIPYIDAETEEVIPHSCVVGGDGKYQGIAAASILAKVARDEFMKNLHVKYPHYSWESNKGYGTKAHYAAIKEHGVTPHHRMSYNLHLTTKSKDDKA